MSKIEQAKKQAHKNYNKKKDTGRFSLSALSKGNFLTDDYEDFDTDTIEVSEGMMTSSGSVKELSRKNLLNKNNNKKFNNKNNNYENNRESDNRNNERIDTSKIDTEDLLQRLKQRYVASQYSHMIDRIGDKYTDDTSIANVHKFKLSGYQLLSINQNAEFRIFSQLKMMEDNLYIKNFKQYNRECIVDDKEYEPIEIEDVENASVDDVVCVTIQGLVMRAINHISSIGDEFKSDLKTLIEELPETVSEKLNITNWLSILKKIRNIMSFSKDRLSLDILLIISNILDKENYNILNRGVEWLKNTFIGKVKDMTEFVKKILGSIFAGNKPQITGNVMYVNRSVSEDSELNEICYNTFITNMEFIEAV